MFLGTAITVLRKRSRDNRLTLVVAFINVVLATVLMAAAPLYSAAVSLAGVREALKSAPPDDVTITVSTTSNGSDTAGLDERVTGELQSALGPTGGTINRGVRPESYAFADQSDQHTLVVFRYEESISSHAALVSGAWPDFHAGHRRHCDSQLVADQLGMAVGDELRLVNPTDRCMSASPASTSPIA